jgi:serine/threonine protein kinase
MATVKPGDTFGDWEIASEHPKSGGNSRVWEVRRTSSSTQTGAIKLLNSNRFSSNRYQRFIDEVNFVESCNDEGVLPILDSYLPATPNGNDRPWYVMPLAKQLQDLIKPDLPRLEEVIRLLVPIGKALARLHSRRVAHRDIKPDNLLWFEGKPVLGDFGIVDYPDKVDATGSDEVMGPAFFVAPELCGNAADVDARPGDVYSFAKTLWVLAAQRRWPYPGRFDIGDKRLRVSTYAPHREGQLIDHLLDHATRTSPTDRPAMNCVADNLNKWMEIVSMKNDDKEPSLDELRYRFAAIEATHAADIAKEVEDKGAAEAAFNRVVPAVTAILKEAADVAHGKFETEWLSKKLPPAEGQKETRVARSEGRSSSQNMTYGFYCKRAGERCKGIAVQVSIAAFSDSITEACVTLYVSNVKVRSRTSKMPGVTVITANPKATFWHFKTVWGIHIEEQTGSVALVAALEKVGQELRSQMSKALQELYLVLQGQDECDGHASSDP